MKLETLEMVETDSPIGRFRIFAKSGKLYRIELPGSGDISEENSNVRIGSISNPVFIDVINYLNRYFKGERLFCDMKQIPDGSDFYKKVWKELVKVPFGKTISYGELASKAGSPRAARAVGSAMANNPIPILIPCHRVITPDGRLGGFGGGLDMKRWLLKHEGIEI
ncbi:methylated-DNA--[protein]-cysteine S-methyltransferase [bacterium]|nr:methylated-DNA--[protein]-cysteine S-methyltransferase [bacterium]